MFHIKDEEFIRGKAPMTKEEIRAVSLAKLEMKNDDICLDIGGGTGSVTMEMAQFAKDGHVYVIEQKEDAFELIKQNVEKFDLKNVTYIKGEAPEGLSHLDVKFDTAQIPFKDTDICQIIVSKNRKVKDFNMMMAENPIYVITARK